MSEDDRSQLLVVIFDVNPVWWGLKTLQRTGQITKCLDCLLVFINSYLMMHHENKIVVIASHTSKSQFLYPNEKDEIQVKDNEGKEDSRYDKFALVNDTIVDGFKELMSSEINESEIRRDSLIAGSLTIALCYLHRMAREAPPGKQLKPRILVVKAADDAAAQYMSFMNAIFAAQKQQIVIDSCLLGQDSGLLQQACDMTGGIYMKIPKQEALLQYLLTIFLVDAESRKRNLSLTSSNERRSGVDFRAACFCHRNLVDIGFVCSVCLSIFCQFSPICTTCETAFKPPPSLAMKPRKKKRASQVT